MTIRISDYIQCAKFSAIAEWVDLAPWELISNARKRVESMLAHLPLDEYKIVDQIAIHCTAVIEAGAMLKGPLIIGPACFIASGAYLRDGCWLSENCVIGPGVELKSSFIFRETKLAHFNFVGDSILGVGVNLEAGSIVCNFRNERENKDINVRVGLDLQSTGSEKFGALIGDEVRVGANAVLAPGALLLPRTVIHRLSLYDCETSW